MDALTRPILLLTDYGLHDSYVGQVKTVIAGIAPRAAVIDLTHDIAPFAVDEGAWTLEIAMPALPANAVVMAVVDPGVGTPRRPLALQSGNRLFVGPDNGLLSAVVPEELRRHVDGELGSVTPGAGLDARELCSPWFRRSTVSATFHGRDVFAPAAAMLAAGADLRLCGPPVDRVSALAPFEAVPAGQDALIASVIHVDRFGNLITTIRGPQLFPRFELRVGGERIAHRVNTFAEALPGVLMCHLDSSGFIAVSMNQGSAATRLGVGRGAPVRVIRR
jgi:hypothetical protein